jgi:uncharacterized YccA/Bax inhibitor family protein
MRSSNPLLNDKTFAATRAFDGQSMTINGTVQKTAGLLFLIVCSAAYTWELARTNPSQAMPWMIGGAIGAFISVLIAWFNKNWSPVLAPAYALLKGLMLGGVSAFANARYPGIVVSAVALTFGVLGSLLVVYRTGLIKATENFKLGVAAATGGIFLVYLVTMILGFFGREIPYIHASGTFGIAFSIFVVIMAALNLVLDFDFIENGAASGAPRYMEWFAALGLMVTLVWLYLEILRLLSKLNSRR